MKVTSEGFSPSCTKVVEEIKPGHALPIVIPVVDMSHGSFHESILQTF